MTRRRLLTIVCLTLIAGALGSGVARANTLVTITIPDSHNEIPAKWLNYYTGTPRANVLLPDGYNPHRRYPLLVLLHGLNGDYNTYAFAGDLTVFNGFPGIVVMPEGADGWYTDWWNNGERGSPAWESYELNEVVPSILARFPILPERRYHAIAGISMGGLGAAYLGSRLPGFFGSVASLSGFVDPQYFALMFVDRSVPRISREYERFAFLREILEILRPDMSVEIALTTAVRNVEVCSIAMWT